MSIIQLTQDNTAFGQTDESWFDNPQNACDKLVQIGNNDELSALSTGANAVIATIELAENTVDPSARTILAVEAAIHALKSKLKIYPLRSPVNAAFESYGRELMGVSSRRAYVRLAIEEWHKTAINIILKIIEWIKKAYGVIKDGIFRAAKTAEGLSNRGANLEVLAKEAAVKHKKEDASISDKALVKYFTADGAFLSFDEISQRYKQHTSSLGSQYTVDAIKQISNGLIHIAAAVEEDQKKDTIAQLTDSFLTQLKTTLFKGFKEGHRDHASDDDFDILSHELPFDNKSFAVVFGKDTGMLNDVRVLMKDGAKNNQPGDSALEVLSPANCMKLSRLIQDEMMLGIFKHHKDLAAEIHKAQNVIDKACDRVTRKLKSSDEVDRDNMLSVDFIKNIFSAAANLIGLLHNYDLLSSSRILDYCEASLKCYED